MAATRIIPELRKESERALELGGCGLIRAFNLTKEQSWAFSAEVRARVERLLAELIHLHADSEIHARPIALAKGDSNFQQFLQAAMAKPARTRTQKLVAVGKRIAARRVARKAQERRSRGTGSGTDTAR